MENKKFCSYCGKDILESADVCLHCGKIVKEISKDTFNQTNYIKLTSAIALSVFAQFLVIYGILVSFVYENQLWPSDVAGGIAVIVAIISIILIFTTFGTRIYNDNKVFKMFSLGVIFWTTSSLILGAIIVMISG